MRPAVEPYETMTEPTEEKTGYLIAEAQPFAQSLLWDIQQAYYADKGIQAWREDELPHYVTSNPTVASSYAEIVLACWRDQQRLAAGSKTGDEPLYICELGSGSGRFAYHFLRRLTRLCEQTGVSPTSFCYVLTDVVERTLAFWRRHPRFQAYFERGMLDLAFFDVNQSDRLQLQQSGRTIAAGSLERPLVAVANYLFDSIPQELFYFDDQRGYQCLVSLLTEEDPKTLPMDQLVAHLQVKYDYQELTEAPYPEPYLQQLLETYRHELTDTHLLFPVAGLRCLENLKALSKKGLLLLSADKGSHRFSDLRGRKPPTVVSHDGCFSLSVNYHAFKACCEQSGGLALFPNHYHHLNVGYLLLLDEAENYTETRGAYQRHVQEFGPDEFYSISKHARQNITEMSTRDVLAYLRLSYYDAHLFTHYQPRLLALIPELGFRDREALIDAVDKVWDMYFPLGEKQDLACDIANLLCEMEQYARALIYFERSIQIYGEHTGALYSMAVCYRSLEQHQQAKTMLQNVVERDPDNHQARTLLAEYGPGTDSALELPRE